MSEQDNNSSITKDHNKTLEQLRNSNLPIIWIVGGPGAGKGTQCQKIIAKYNYVHISTGHLLRTEVNNGTTIGKQVQNCINQGQLVPLQIILTILKNEMCRLFNRKKSGFLIDGYPRSYEQAVAFVNDITPVTIIIYFECSDKMLKERLLKRGRADDTHETIDKRLELFHRSTLPILEAFPNKIRKINAERTIDEIFQDVENIIVNELPKV